MDVYRRVEEGGGMYPLLIKNWKLLILIPRCFQPLFVSPKNNSGTLCTVVYFRRKPHIVSKRRINKMFNLPEIAVHLIVNKNIGPCSVFFYQTEVYDQFSKFV